MTGHYIVVVYEEYNQFLYFINSTQSENIKWLKCSFEGVSKIYGYEVSGIIFLGDSKNKLSSTDLQTLMTRIRK